MKAASPSAPARSQFVRVAGVYAVILLLAGLVACVVITAGQGLEAPAPPVPTEPSQPIAVPFLDPFAHVLIALTSIIVVGRVFSWLLRPLWQPPVIGEILAGIALGPSLLGRIWPEASAVVLPASVAPYLGVIAQLGVILYLFLVGMDLDVDLLRRHGHSTIAISHASIVAPFALGVLIALWLYPLLSHCGVPFTGFALFMGVSLSVTAFPVLARLLSDQGLHRTNIGVMALGAAAIDDATAWCLLALVLGIVQSEVGHAFVVLALAVAYLAFMLGVARWALARRLTSLPEHQVTPAVTAALLAGLLLSALATELIGIHALFGAFVYGAVIPPDCAVARVTRQRLHDLVTILMLPAFFALTGLRTEIGLVASGRDWLICAIIILAATAGKFGGTVLAARFTGQPWRTAAILGALMNTRGLMELIVLNIGLQRGLIDPPLFAMMVIMALVTTMMAAPLVRVLIVGDQANGGP